MTTRHARPAPPADLPATPAILELEAMAPLSREQVDSFLAAHTVPIVEGYRCTFLFRGEADGQTVFRPKLPHFLRDGIDDEQRRLTLQTGICGPNVLAVE